MRFLIEIVTHTPVWVWALLAYLIWAGIQAMQPRRVSVWRLMVVPAVFIVTGLTRIWTGQSGGSLLAWLAGAIPLAVTGFLTGPKLLDVDRDKAEVTRPGSPVPLIRNVAVFALQYAAAVIGALHTNDQAAAALFSRALSGGTAGYFIGWAAAFWRHYRSAPQATGAG